MALIALPIAASAQTASPPGEPEAAAVMIDPQVGQTAEASTGRVGQRQSRADAGAGAQAHPMVRINNRIANRVQTRIRNRIDRNYDPAANATSPFRITADQVRAIGRARR